MRLWLRGILVLFCAGCATTLSSVNPSERQQMETRIFQASKDEVITAVVQMLQDSGFSIAVLDRTGGLVSTDPLQSASLLTQSMLGDTRAKVSATVTIPTPGSAQVRVKQTVEIPGYNAEWFIQKREYETFCKNFFTGVENRLPRR